MFEKQIQIRELFGNYSGTIRELFGNYSGTIRELFGNNSPRSWGLNRNIVIKHEIKTENYQK